MSSKDEPLRRTPARHRMLAQVAAGPAEVYVGLYWNLVFDGTFVKGAQLRTANEVRPLLRHKVVFHRHTPVKLNDAGSALLSEWNEKHGNPLADQGKEGPTA